MELQRLLHDFTGREVADHPVDARGAENAAHRAADLRADADGVMSFVVAQQHALDLLVIGQLQEKFFRPVGGLSVLCDAGGPNLELVAERAAQLRGQIGHLVKRRGPLLKQPFSHLSRSVTRQAVLDEPVAELSGRLFENWDHLTTMSACILYQWKGKKIFGAGRGGFVVA